MSPTAIALICLVLGLALGAVFMWVYRQAVLERNRKNAISEADRIINRAKQESARLDREAKAKAKDIEARVRKNTEADIVKQKQNLKRAEDEVKNREAQLENDFKRRQAQIERRQAEIEAQNARNRVAETRLKSLEGDIQKSLEELRAKLEKVATVSSEEAKRELVKALEDEARAEADKKAVVIEAEAKKEVEIRSKRLISTALARFASEYTAERTVSFVPLTSEEMKGKIIGREGRNIRSLEAACGVDLIVDEAPEAVVISGFDPVRREIAKRTLEKLMEDGRVHPGRIEEVVEKVKKDLFKFIKEEGEKACFELGIHGLHPELIKLIGQLRYRSTLTQNNYQHCMEVGFLAGLMAEELGVDAKLARRAGLLHDIGKAVDHTHDGSHSEVGADVAKRHGESEIVVQAIREHENTEAASHVIGFLVQTANLISQARPGARRGNMDSYVRRLEDMESIGNSFDGVLRTFAVQAGRELRVMVESAKVTDEQAMMLSRDIVRKIERELSYPGQIKVTVIREIRAIEMAR